jgi:WD40 repeat protein
MQVKFINKGTQLVSGSADGLVRLWTIQTGECEGTFDEHQDKIWSICVSSSNEKQFFSGGSDSKLLKWMDVTAEEEAKRLSDREQNLLLEQVTYLLTHLLIHLLIHSLTHSLTQGRLYGLDLVGTIKVTLEEIYDGAFSAGTSNFLQFDYTNCVKAFKKYDECVQDNIEVPKFSFQIMF